MTLRRILVHPVVQARVDLRLALHSAVRDTRLGLSAAQRSMTWALNEVLLAPGRGAIELRRTIYLSVHGARAGLKSIPHSLRYALGLPARTAVQPSSTPAE